MQRKIKMTNKIKLIFTILLAFTLTFVMLGCGREGEDLEGKNIVTFELSGGTLELKTSSVDTKINFAYYPGTYILDPIEIPGYKMYRQGYNFTGWYTSPDCNPQDKWDFKTPFNTETLTLYAGWEKAIKYTYTLFYVEGGEAKPLGRYDVKADAEFSDWRNIAKNRDDYTPIGYYSDADMTAPWDYSFKHPGGEADTDVAVYVDYIAGNWTLVDSFSALKSAISSGKNIYLTKDIDCDGQVLINHLQTTSYAGIFEGNGFTVSNFKAEKSGLIPNVAIFKELGKNAEIRNVSFTSVIYDLQNVGANVDIVRAAALAIDAKENVKVSNVTITGTLTTNFTGDLSKVNSWVYEDTAVVDATNSTVNITVESQN